MTRGADLDNSADRVRAAEDFMADALKAYSGDAGGKKLGAKKVEQRPLETQYGTDPSKLQFNSSVPEEPV